MAGRLLGLTARPRKRSTNTFLSLSILKTRFKQESFWWKASFELQTLRAHSTKVVTVANVWEEWLYDKLSRKRSVFVGVLSVHCHSFLDTKYSNQEKQVYCRCFNYQDRLEKISFILSWTTVKVSSRNGAKKWWFDKVNTLCFSTRWWQSPKILKPLGSPLRYFRFFKEFTIILD